MGRSSNVREDVALGRDVRVAPLAIEIGVPPVTLYSQIARGQLEGRKIGRLVIVPNAAARRVLGLPEAFAEDAHRLRDCEAEQVAPQPTAASRAA